MEFAKCLEDPEILTAVKSDYVQGQALGIKGTPSYTINGILHSGALNYHQLQDKLKQIARSD